MIGTTSGLLLNSDAMRLMIPLERSTFTGFDCHCGYGILWPELSKLGL
jgi:hypothetical protein